MPNRSAHAVLTILVAAACAAPAAAQQRPDPAPDAAADTFRLDRLVVTAARLPIRLAEAPGAVTVVTGDELRRRGVRLVAEALQTVPGVAVVQTAGPGALTSVFLRGGESDYVQVLVDGVQVNDPGGAFDWAHLRAEDIDRIEVVRGPASVLYGSDAVSGVVQVFTRSGGAPRVQASAASGLGDKRGDDATGRFRTNSVDASIAGTTAVPFRGARLHYGASGAHQQSNGLQAFNNDYDNTTLSGRLQLVATGFDAALTARASDNRHHYPTSGSGALVDTNQFATGNARSIGLDAGYRFTQALELRVLGTTHRNETRQDNPPEPGDDATFWSTGEQTRHKLDARLNARWRAATLTGGIEREWQASQTAYESVSAWGTFSDETDETRTNTGWYAQVHTTPLAGVAATVGGRIDENEAFGTFRTGRAALSWTPVRGMRVHGAWGTAFKEPTFFETFATGYTRGNPELEPEQARSIEAGVEQAIAGSGITIGATWFDQRFRNLIQYTATPPGPEAPNYFNIGAARAHGAELSLRAETGIVAASAQYTWTSTRVTDAGFGSDVAFQQDLPLLRRPRHSASAGAAIRLAPAVRGLVDVRHTGSREDLDFTDPQNWAGSRVTLPAFTTFDAGAEFAVLRRGADLDVTLRVRNLFDERYQEIYNFPAAGRVLQVGVRALRGL